MAETAGKQKASIPLYAKVGWLAAWVTLLVVAAMMLRNCATSVYYGLRTHKAQVESAYQTGRKDGENGQGAKLSGDIAVNPVLHKSYTKGYREGLDHRQARSPEPEAPAKTTPAATSSPPPAATYADFSDFDLSTPQKAVISFVELTNGIMPVSPPTDLTKICARAATESYQPACLQLLKDRVDFLKGIAIKLKEAHFSYQPLAELKLKNDQGLYRASWKETFTFFDKTTQVNDKTMTVELKKVGKEWRVSGIKD